MSERQRSGGCRVDSWVLAGGDAWLRCSHGTLGCPRCHDGLTPHCIHCAAESGHACPYRHDPLVVEMTVEEHCQLYPEQAELLLGRKES